MSIIKVLSLSKRANALDLVVTKASYFLVLTVNNFTSLWLSRISTNSWKTGNKYPEYTAKMTMERIVTIIEILDWLKVVVLDIGEIKSLARKLLNTSKLCQ